MGVHYGFRPNLIRGINLWLDAADFSTQYDSDINGSLVAADGLVGRWEDKSGNNNHAVQVTSGNRPQRKTSQQNNRDTIYFNGSEKQMVVPTITIGDVFCVFKRSSQNQSVFRRNSSSYFRGFLGSAYPSYSTHVVYKINNGSALSSPPNSATGASYFMVHATSSQVASDGITIGDDYPAYLDLNGNIAELIVFDRSLSVDEAGVLSTYLIKKWNI